MNHLRDDDLVLHYYGEDGPEAVSIERHLRSCAQCADAYEALTRTLCLVTPPEVVEAPDDMVALRQLLRDRARGQLSPVPAQAPAWQSEPVAIALTWLVPLLYPWSVPALFASARWAHDVGPGIALTVLMLLWTCAGPLVALLALHGIADRLDWVSTRLRVLGAVMAAITPPLFMLIARGGERLPAWYVTLGAAAVLSLVPWPELSGPALRLRFAHRLSAALLGIFILGHIVNQSLAFVSVESYAVMRSVMRVASQQSISYAVIVTSVGMQIVTGMAMGLKQIRSGALARNLQAVSGWYLAVFLLSHVFGGFLLSLPVGAPRVAGSLEPPYLLDSASMAAALPYYILGVTAFLVHVGMYARLTALGWLGEPSVRRLSYAAAFVGAMVVVTVGLSLCGIHVLL